MSSIAEPTAAPTLPRSFAASTLCEAFQITAAERPDALALRTPGGGVEITWAEYAERVRRIAGGLAAIGIGHGDAVALMMTNRPEFNLIDTAAMHLGATPFSIYNTSAPDQISYLFSNADNRVVVCEHQFLDIIRAADAPLVEHVVVIDGEFEGTISLADLETMRDKDFDFGGAWRAVKPDDVLTLIYTSGTTGPPKGVQLTHASVMAENRGCAAVIPFPPFGRFTSYLPSAHIGDRWGAHYYTSIMYGATVTAIADVRQVVGVLPEVRPSGWGTVPRIWEKVKASLEAKGITDPAVLPDDAKADVRVQLGLDQAQWLTSAAAPIPREVLSYFHALGLPIFEFWGMSELSCAAVINPADDIRIGTVGKAIPGVELKLLDDGELLVRGPVVMKGYRKDPEKTAEAVDAEGWMHTGDVATIDEDGYVTIIDRKKELIINAAGKNMSPANIEQKLKASSPLIGQAICIGDARPHNVALLVLDPDVGAQWAEQHGLSTASAAALAQDPGVRAEVARGVETANAQLSRVEQIKRFTILPVDWEPGGDELTPTMKLKRKPIHAKYTSEIDALYSN
ncbi:MAG TPA: AMP-dependent synthetase/ligase [Ilumatobacteraceae bacterium]|nr:AMP-dependent synthetase/ligase [Ilumatobacteraceae bacterium]